MSDSERIKALLLLWEWHHLLCWCSAEEKLNPVGTHSHLPEPLQNLLIANGERDMWFVDGIKLILGWESKKQPVCTCKEAVPHLWLQNQLPDKLTYGNLYNQLIQMPFQAGNLASWIQVSLILVGFSSFSIYPTMPDVYGYKAERSPRCCGFCELRAFPLQPTEN